MLHVKATLRNTLISELLVIFVKKKKSRLYVAMLTCQYVFSHERSKLSMTRQGKIQSELYRSNAKSLCLKNCSSEWKLVSFFSF